MLEGPAGIGSGPVLPRDQTLVCSFNVLILSFFFDCFLYLFFLPLRTPNMNVTGLLPLIRWCLAVPVQRSMACAPPALPEVKRASVLGSHVCVPLELRGCILGSALSPSVTEGPSHARGSV